MLSQHVLGWNYLVRGCQRMTLVPLLAKVRLLLRDFPEVEVDSGLMLWCKQVLGGFLAQNLAMLGFTPKSSENKQRMIDHVLDYCCFVKSGVNSEASSHVLHSVVYQEVNLIGLGI
jgi:hypothetical protein